MAMWTSNKHVSISWGLESYPSLPFSFVPKRVTERYMVNVAIHLGSVGLTIVLFLISLVLLLDDSGMWNRFFVLGVYIATWSTLWGVVRGVASQVIEAVRTSKDAEEYIWGTLIVYGVAIPLSFLLTWWIGAWILGVVSDSKWDVLSVTG